MGHLPACFPSGPKLKTPYEEWLKHRVAQPEKTKHSSPVEDLYEAWAEKRVEKRLSKIG